MSLLRVLKEAVRVPEVFDQIPHEVLDPLELELILEFKGQQAITPRPTLKSLATGLLDRSELRAGVRTLVTGIKDAADLDPAELDMELFRLNVRAKSRVIQDLNTPELDQKTHDKLMARLTELHQYKPSRWMKPINITDWKKMEIIEEEEINLLINWFRMNDVPIKKNNLYTFIATTNGGKTVIKTWFATELVKTGANVLYLAQEEPHQDTIRRICQTALNLSEWQYKQLLEEHKSYQPMIERYHKIKEEKGWGNIDIVEWTNRPVGEIEREVEKRNTNPDTDYKWDAVVIDYGTLIETSSPRKNLAEWERLGSIFAELKRLAMNQSIAVITSVQLNKQATEKLVESNRVPELHDIAGAFSIAQHTNYIIAVTLIPTNGDIDLKDPNVVRGTYTLTILKQKYGNLRKGDRRAFQWYTTHNLQEMEVELTDDLLTEINDISNV